MKKQYITPAMMAYALGAGHLMTTSLGADTNPTNGINDVEDFLVPDEHEWSSSIDDDLW